MINAILNDISTACKRCRWLLAFVGTICAILIVRAKFGVGMTDESYYFTQVIRLLKGEKLFSDIWDITQTQGIPLLPLYWLYTRLFGYDGLLLFGRIYMLAFNLFTAVFVYYALSQSIRRKTAALIALFTVTCAPFGLLTVSYNNMMQTFMLLGCALLYIAVCDPKSERWDRLLLLLGGLSHALMVASYPAFVVTLPLLCALLFFCAQRRYRSMRSAARALLWYAIGLMIVAGALAAYVLLRVGLRNALYGIGQMLSSPILNYPSKTVFQQVQSVLKSLLNTAGTTRMTVYAVLAGFALYIAFESRFPKLLGRLQGARSSAVAALLICVCGVGLCCFIAMQYQRFLLAACIAFLAALVGLREHTRTVLYWGTAAWVVLWSCTGSLYGNSGSSALHIYACMLSLLLPLQLLTLQKANRESAAAALLLLAMPSLLITAMISLFSSGFFINARWGLFCAGACSVLLTARCADTILPDTCERRAQSFARLSRFMGQIALPVIVIIASTFMYFTFVMGDWPVRLMDTTVTRGPGKGIYTGAKRAQMLDQMSIDLNEYAVADGKLLVLESCSYAYGLCEDMTPFATSTYTASMKASGFYSWIPDFNYSPMPTYMEYRGAYPDVIFYYEPEKYGGVKDSKYCLHVFIQENYTCVLQREDYWIYHLRTTARKETK